MNNFLRASCNEAKNFSPLPNAIFNLGLSAGKLARLPHVLRGQKVTSVLAELHDYRQSGGHE